MCIRDSYMTVYRWVRTSRLAAEKSGGIWKVRLGDLEALTGGGARGTSKADSAGRHRPARFDGSRLAPMTAALLRGDQGGAWLLVEESRRAGIDPVDVLCELIEPAMAEIGRRWRNGEVSVADEHRATVVASRLIGRLDVYKRQVKPRGISLTKPVPAPPTFGRRRGIEGTHRSKGRSMSRLGCFQRPTDGYLRRAQAMVGCGLGRSTTCLLYTSRCV